MHFMKKLLLTLCLILIPAIAAPAATPEEEKKVEAFLDRLNLIDLQIVYLEKQLGGDSLPAEKRTETAKRLADMYAERLMSAGDDAEKFAQIEAQIRKLIERSPEANTTSLQVMMLQADFNRGEERIKQWLGDRSKTKELEEAKEILARIAPQLSAHQKELNGQAEELRQQINKTEDEAEQARLMKEAARRAPVTGRATYFAGWANYYAGLTLTGEAATAAFTEARAAQRAFLELDPLEKYKDVDVDFLGLQNDYRARAMIGLGQAEIALGALKEADACFKFLEHVNVPLAIRDGVAYYHVQGLLNAGLQQEALAFADQHLKTFGGNATQGKIDFCRELLNAGFKTINPSPISQQLGDMGVKALARLGQIAFLRAYMKAYSVELPDGDGFYMTWLRGEQQFDEASKTKSKDAYQAALSTLNSALKKPDARTDLASAGECRYKVGLCLFHLEQYEKAAAEFEQAIPALKSAGGDSALNAAWSAFVAYYKLTAKGDARHVSSAIGVLERIKTDFPGSDKARNANSYIAKLKQAGASTADSIASWEKIKPTDSNYYTALYELARLRQRAWKEVSGDAKAAAAKALGSAIDKYLSIAGRDNKDSRKLDVLMIAAETELAQGDAAKSAQHVAQGAILAGTLPASESAVQKYHYYALTLAQKQSNAAEVQQHAQWLHENAKGSAYERVAIILLAQKTAANISTMQAAGQTPDYEEAYNIYLRLAQVTGESARALESDKNARVANSRLASYEMQTGRNLAAARRLQRLLETDPKNESYLKRAARAEHAAGEHQAALDHARILVKGLAKNTEAWYEAKWIQLDSLRRIDPAQAKSAHQQFRVLYPKIKYPTWDEKFKMLDTQL